MDTLASVLHDPRVQRAMSSSAVRGTAALGTLLLALQLYLSSKKDPARVRRARHVSSPTEVARRVKKDEREYDDDEFDVVIVGGGTSGCVVASRLSEDPSIRVLLLEAGQSGRGIPETHVPAAYGKLWFTEHEWGMKTEPQTHAGGRTIFWPRAKLLGGCTNMNAMMFHYGAPSDYDEWARLQHGEPGADAWSYKEFHRYFRQFERYNPSGAFPDVDVTLRGAHGVVDIGHYGHFAPSTRAFIEAAANAGIAQSHDVNTHKGTLGTTKIMTYIDKTGKRVTAESAYLTPEVTARPNLKIATGARATRLLFDTSTPGTPRAVGVEFMDKAGAKYAVKARKEVVVCAGAVHTPQLLMLSGIGPAAHLASFGIPVVADLPGVGAHLTDHIVVDLAYKDRTHTSLAYLRPKGAWQTLQFVKAVLQYQLTGTGPLTCNVGEAVAFLRSTDPALFPAPTFDAHSAPEDAATGPDAPDIELFCSPMAYSGGGIEEPPAWGTDAFALHAVVLRPRSRGTVRLRSADPADPPVIDPKYLSDDTNNDVKTLVRGVRLLHRLAHTPPLAALIDPAGETHPELQHALGGPATSDADIAAYVRARVQTLYHPACTARMAPREHGGVVDTRLRVHGVPSVRVADASVFPSLMAGHTTAPCYAVGEKAAELIRADVGQEKR